MELYRLIQELYTYRLLGSCTQIFLMATRRRKDERQ